MKKTKTIKAYHFTDDKLRDGRPIPPKMKWIVHEGELIPCESGLHASEHPFDALQFAPGNLLHLVELGGEIKEHGNPVDKLCARKRRILKSINAEPLLREFSRWCALQVVHLWECPPIVKQYLETGDESIRAAAGAAAGDAAWAAAQAAAGDAAWAAARAAAGDAAWAAAQAAAGAAAWDAAWDAAQAAAGDAAAGAAAWVAAWAAAWAAFIAKAHTKFQEMVDAAFEKESL